MRKEFVSRQQLDLLPERLRKVEKTDATKELNIYMCHLYEKNRYQPMKIMIVGAGGSYPAAIFAKHATLREMRTANVEAVTPQTAIRILTQFDHVNNGEWNPKYDLVIGISYSGRTPDIKNVYDICNEKGLPFALVTGVEKSTLSDIYTESNKMNIISYFNAEDTTGKERGMISMTSTLAPIIVFDDNWTCKLISENQEALANGEKFVSELNIHDIARKIKQKPVIHVFYEWDTLPTAIDIESKFTESGIANVIIHEKKNFSHGRYTLLYKQNFALAINLVKYRIENQGENTNKSYRSMYDENLAIFLKERCKAEDSNYLEIETVAAEAKQWNIEAMTKLPYFITTIGEELGIDVSKPLKPFPEEAAGLYAYKGIF